MSVRIEVFYASEVRLQISFPPNLQKDSRKNRGKTEKREGEKHFISRDSENHTFFYKRHGNMNFNSIKPTGPRQLLWLKPRLNHPIFRPKHNSPPPCAR